MANDIALKTASIWLSAQVLKTLPVVGEGQPYHLWSAAGGTDADSAVCFWPLLQTLITAGYVITLLTTTIFVAPEGYKLRAQAYLDTPDGKSANVKAGYYYNGDCPRVFFAALGVRTDDVNKIL